MPDAPGAKSYGQDPLFKMLVEQYGLDNDSAMNLTKQANEKKAGPSGQRISDEAWTQEADHHTKVFTHLSKVASTYTRLDAKAKSGTKLSPKEQAWYDQARLLNDRAREDEVRGASRGANQQAATQNAVQTTRQVGTRAQEMGQAYQNVANHQQTGNFEGQVPMQVGQAYPTQQVQPTVRMPVQQMPQLDMQVDGVRDVQPQQLDMTVDSVQPANPQTASLIQAWLAQQGRI